MKSFLCATVFAISYWTAFLTNAADIGECKEHEVFQKCICFNVTCEKPYGQIFNVTGNCVSGCICEEKYAYDPKGTCILGPECKRYCNQNQTITNNCIPICPKTCPGVKQPPCLRNERCVTPCVIGCVCRDGYVLDARGNCILVKDCPKY